MWPTRPFIYKAGHRGRAEEGWAASSDVVEVWLALPPTALPVPSFVPLCAPSRRHLAWRMRRCGSVGASSSDVEQ